MKTRLFGLMAVALTLAVAAPSAASAQWLVGGSAAVTSLGSLEDGGDRTRVIDLAPRALRKMGDVYVGGGFDLLSVAVGGAAVTNLCMAPQGVWNVSGSDFIIAGAAMLCDADESTQVGYELGVGIWKSIGAETKLDIRGIYNNTNTKLAGEENGNGLDFFGLRVGIVSEVSLGSGG